MLDVPVDALGAFDMVKVPAAATVEEHTDSVIVFSIV